MHSLVRVHFPDFDASLGRTAGAHGQDEVGVLRADHGSGIVWAVVGGTADRFASWAVDDNASWVVRVVLHRWDDFHATGGEGVAVDVGKVIGDLSVGPGELKLGDRSRDRVVRGKLDGDTNTFFAVALAVAALKCAHAGTGILADRRVVDGESTVVDHSSAPKGHN